MSIFDSLPSVADVNARPHATPKAEIVPRVIARAEKKKTKAKLEAEFRAGVWLRDGGKSRASGRPLAKSGVSPEDVGEVHHVLARSTDPDKRLDVGNGILLSRAEHQLAETACPADPQYRLLEINGPEDRGQLQLFTWRNLKGQVLRKRVG